MKLGTQANPLLYVGPQALSYDARQRLRRGVRLLVDLDSIMDAYRNEDSKSEKGSERVEELLESIRSGHGDGKEAVADPTSTGKARIFPSAVGNESGGFLKK